MSEISGPGISVNQLKYAGIQKQAVDVPVEPTEVSEETPQIKDFSNSKAEALGRSMLFKGVDGINNDLKAIMDNPQIVENADELFETAYQVALQEGVENPYEEACKASTTAF